MWKFSWEIYSRRKAKPVSPYRLASRSHMGKMLNGYREIFPKRLFSVISEGGGHVVGQKSRIETGEINCCTASPEIGLSGLRKPYS